MVGRASDSSPGRVAVTVSNSVEVEVFSTVTSDVVVSGETGAADEPPPTGKERVGDEDGGMGTTVWVTTGMTDELGGTGITVCVTTDAAELEVGTPAAEVEGCTGQLGTSGAQEVMVYSSTSVTVETTGTTELLELEVVAVPLVYWIRSVTILPINATYSHEQQPKGTTQRQWPRI